MLPIDRNATINLIPDEGRIESMPANNSQSQIKEKLESINCSLDSLQLNSQNEKNKIKFTDKLIHALETCTVDEYENLLLAQQDKLTQNDYESYPTVEFMRFQLGLGVVKGNLKEAYDKMVNKFDEDANIEYIKRSIINGNEEIVRIQQAQILQECKDRDAKKLESIVKEINKVDQPVTEKVRNEQDNMLKTYEDEHARRKGSHSTSRANSDNIKNMKENTYEAEY